jgi:hypothetical protein
MRKAIGIVIVLYALSHFLSESFSALDHAAAQSFKTIESAAQVAEEHITQL